MQATPNPSDGTPAAPTSPADETAVPAAPQQASLLRNTVYLTLAQAATVPVAVVSNALVGRYLGPTDFGHMYLAGTMCAFAVLVLEWGQQGAVPALVARDRPHAGTYLGTSLVWRSLMGMLMFAVLALMCRLLGYGTAEKWAVALMFPASVLTSCAAGFKDTIRGFERTDIPALAHVGQQFLGLGVLVAVLLLGGRLRAVLIGPIVVAVLVVLFLRRASRRVGVGTLRYDRSTLTQLFKLGTPFVFFDMALVLLPIVNATFLAKLVPPEVIGWYGVTQRLIGLLLFPASALIGALYPTLCRLHPEDMNEFVRVGRNALYGTALLAVPAAVGCGLFPELGVLIFGPTKFAGAADHLRVMSVFVFLVYFSMPLGTCILASNRQRAWALVQSSCIAVSLMVNPFLIPYFQRSHGNGAIGTCIALVASEAFVIGCGIALAPRGIFNRDLAKSLSLAAASGAAMGLVAWLTKPISIFLAVPAALLTYAVAAYFSGAIQPSTLDMLKAFFRRRLARKT